MVHRFGTTSYPACFELSRVLFSSEKPFSEEFSEKPKVLPAQAACLSMARGQGVPETEGKASKGWAFSVSAD